MSDDKQSLIDDIRKLREKIDQRRSHYCSIQEFDKAAFMRDLQIRLQEAIAIEVDE